MPRGYRSIILAAVGWLILCGAQPPQEKTSSSASASQTKPAPQLVPSPSPTPSASPTPKFTAYPGYNPDPCYRAQDKDAADLCAQWRAAIAAEKAAHEARRATFWAIFATFLSLIGVGGLIYTIWQTNGALGEARRGNRIMLLIEKRARREARDANEATERALVEARRNADAAARQAEIAEETAKLELRAYLFPGHVHLIITKSKTGAAKCDFTIHLCNSGKTPARLVFHQVYVAFHSPKTVPVIAGDGATKWRDAGEIITNVEQLIGPGGWTEITKDATIGETHFDHAGRRIGLMMDKPQTIIEVTIEWAYIDYLDRKWIESAVFTSPNLEWDGHSDMDMYIRQTRAKRLTKLTGQRSRPDAQRHQK